MFRMFARSESVRSLISVPFYSFHRTISHVVPRNGNGESSLIALSAEFLADRVVFSCLVVRKWSACSEATFERDDSQTNGELNSANRTRAIGIRDLRRSEVQLVMHRT
ncbi:hypothetical protein PUN28_003370 [Cardiocondyla obscurior]|uniref:Uncharacterized protein n=1 Tax=Cardiocondyla obscurior TaxID=286306 RepID=A0AAW2GJC1_9HYME